MLEGAEARGVAEGSVEIGSVVAGAQDEDAPCLVAPDARGPGGEQPEERGSALAEALKRGGELVEIDGALAPRGRMVTRGIELVAGATRGELVARDATEVGGVDEQLALGDAHGQDVGHVLVGDGVAVAVPVDEAVDAADAVGNAGGVVGVARQRNELVLLLLDEALETCAPAPPSLVDDGVEPSDELEAQVVEVAKGAAIEERALEFPETALDSGLRKSSQLYAMPEIRRDASL